MHVPLLSQALHFCFGREEIAASCEQAFPQLSLADLRKLLFLDQDADAMKFAEKVSEAARWQILLNRTSTLFVCSCASYTFCRTCVIIYLRIVN
jgi:hypothetical protein